MSSSADLRLRVVFCPNRHFGWTRGVASQGGYVVSLENCEPTGAEATIGRALDVLVRELDEWTQSDYDEAERPWIDLPRGPEAEAIRQGLAGEVLREQLGHQAEQATPVVDEVSDRLPAREEGADQARTPKMFGWLGDGELHVELCPACPTAGWALAWVRSVWQKPESWSCLGRLWAVFQREDGGSWDMAHRDSTGAVEFWELRERAT